VYKYDNNQSNINNYNNFPLLFNSKISPTCYQHDYTCINNIENEYKVLIPTICQQSETVEKKYIDENHKQRNKNFLFIIIYIFITLIGIFIIIESYNFLKDKYYMYKQSQINPI
jgi:hypothetical protein